jgi:hypothetical protein
MQKEVYIKKQGSLSYFYLLHIASNYGNKYGDLIGNVPFFLSFLSRPPILLAPEKKRRFSLGHFLYAHKKKKP